MKPFWGLIFLAVAGCQAARGVATFECDATPPPGHPLIGRKPAEHVETPLRLQGLVLEDPGGRYVLASLDWCTMGPTVYPVFRRALAAGAGTLPSRVAVHCTHTHSAPFHDGVDPAFLETMTRRLETAAREASGRFRAFTHLGTGRGRVVEFASNRRVPGPDGGIRVRYSACKDPDLRAQPEGLVDPWLRTLTFLDGGRPLARLHYYASHPQSFYGDGSVHPDTPGWARKRLEDEEGIPHLWFTGCAGDITAGKYNDGSPEARAKLVDRLLEGMRAAIADTKVRPVDRLAWRVGQGDWPPLELTRLSIGPAEILGLPGEPFVAYQLFAQGSRQDRFVCTAGYGDGGPGYLCTDDAEGGYEPTASKVGPPAERRLQDALQRLLSDPPK
jgi:hypothetical protein